MSQALLQFAIHNCAKNVLHFHMLRHSKPRDQFTGAPELLVVAPAWCKVAPLSACEISPRANFCSPFLA